MNSPVQNVEIKFRLLIKTLHYPTDAQIYNS